MSSGARMVISTPSRANGSAAAPSSKAAATSPRSVPAAARIRSPTLHVTPTTGTGWSGSPEPSIWPATIAITSAGRSGARIRTSPVAPASAAARAARRISIPMEGGVVTIAIPPVASGIESPRSASHGAQEDDPRGDEFLGGRENEEVDGVLQHLRGPAGADLDDRIPRPATTSSRTAISVRRTRRRRPARDRRPGTRPPDRLAAFSRPGLGVSRPPSSSLARNEMWASISSAVIVSTPGAGLMLASTGVRSISGSRSSGCGTGRERQAEDCHGRQHDTRVRDGHIESFSGVHGRRGKCPATRDSAISTSASVCCRRSRSLP